MNEISEKLAPLIEKYRVQCLWFLKEDLVVGSYEEALNVLDLIERYGSVSAFVEARKTKEWLLRGFKKTSVD